MKGIVQSRPTRAAVFLVAALLTLPAAAKPLRVLAIGNSFSQSVCRYLPAAAAAAGEELEFCNLYIGGCPLSTHAKNIRLAAEKPSFAPYAVSWYESGKAERRRKFNANIPQMLATQKWDVVTIQQASPASWKAASYRPAADEVIATIRRLAPQAEIVVHQTWAYNAADGRISGDNPKWGFDQDGMADRVESAYAALAKDFGFRMIPVGLAVRMRREELAKEGRGFGKAQIAALVPGGKIDLGGDPVGTLSWSKPNGAGPDARLSLGGDTIHLNGRGEFLQAVTWLGFLFDRDVRDLSYVPKNSSLNDAECAALRAVAQKALEEAKRRGWR